MTKYFIKTTPPMKDWVECTKDEYMKMERFCGFFSKFDNEPATGSFGKWKDDIEIQGKTEENRPRAQEFMEFLINDQSTDADIKFAMNYPGQGNIIICEGKSFQKIINMPTAQEFMEDYEIKSIEALLDRIPKAPWSFCSGDDFDHWELYSTCPKTGCSMVQDDADVPPDPAFIEYVIRSRDIIERLLEEVKNRPRAQEKYDNNKYAREYTTSR